MATPLLSTCFLDPCPTLIYPSTLNHRKLYPRRLPHFSISFSPEHKRGHIPAIVNKFDPDAQDHHDLGVKAALSILKFYKREISPLLPKSCRYVPTCSEYSMIAYKRYGFVKGSVLTACRICRCNPLGNFPTSPPTFNYILFSEDTSLFAPTPPHPFLGVEMEVQLVNPSSWIPEVGLALILPVGLVRKDRQKMKMYDIVCFLNMVPTQIALATSGFSSDYPGGHGFLWQLNAMR
ncbi:hypothetical protein KSS87_000395 [Heliosperma pusillum]|nr:hypothetical protein KSS87_000395 [Heliosperma pusillum]